MLVEAANLLDADQRAGRAELPDPLPIGSSGQRVVDLLLERLDPPCSTPCSSPPPSPTATSCASSTPCASATSASPSWRSPRSSGVVILDGDRLTFRHPLMRSAAYHDAPRADRRAAHRALAGTLPKGSPARAWHLARAAVGPDESVAQELEEAARLTNQRGAPATAARSWELASRLSPEPGRPGPAAAPRRGRHPRRRDGVGDRAPARPGRRRRRPSTPTPTTSSSASAASSCAAASHRRGAARPSRSRCAAAGRGGGPRRRARRGRRPAVRRPRGLHPRRRLRRHGQRHRGVDDPARPGRRVARRGASTSWPARCASPAASPGGEPLLDRYTEMTGSGRPAVGRRPVPRRGAGPVAGVPAPHRRLRRAARRARRRSAGPWRGAPADQRARRPGRRAVRPLVPVDDGGGPGGDQPRRVQRHAGAGVDGGRRARRCAPPRSATARRARRSAALLRDVAGARAAGDGADRARLPRPQRGPRRGRPGDLPEVERILPVGQGLVRWEPEYAEALVRTGHRTRRSELVDELERPLPPELLWPNGLGRPEGDARRRRRRGVGATSAGPSSGGRGRATSSARGAPRSLWGERLRRARRRAEARTHLERAVELLRGVGATVLAERATTELRAAGGVVGDDMASHQLLTPHELQVARLVVSGASNRDLAAKLFISPRTVEAHLTAIFRKLGVRNRRELSARADRRPRPPAVTDAGLDDHRAAVRSHRRSSLTQSIRNRFDGSSNQHVCRSGEEYVRWHVVRVRRLSGGSRPVRAPSRWCRRARRAAGLRRAGPPHPAPRTGRHQDGAAGHGLG